MHYICLQYLKIPVAQLCRSVINHRQEVGKQRGKAALAQRCPACILVKGTSAELRRRWMCVRYLRVNNITASERWRHVLTGGKQMEPEQREAAWLPLQLSSTGRTHAGCWAALKCPSAHPHSQREDTEVCLLAKVRRDWEIFCGWKCEGGVEHVAWGEACVALLFCWIFFQCNEIDSSNFLLNVLLLFVLFVNTDFLPACSLQDKAASGQHRHLAVNSQTVKRYISGEKEPKHAGLNTKRCVIIGVGFQPSYFKVSAN